MTAFGFGRASGGSALALSPIGAALDLDFRANRHVRLGREESFASLLAFSRPGPAEWLAASGATLAPTAAADVLRRDAARGALIESAATNLFLNAFSPATQALSLPAGSYTAQVHGPAGSVSLSGAASGSALPGAPLLFTLGAPGLVTATVAGAPLAVSVTPTTAALATGPFAPSPIRTLGAPADRPAEQLGMPLAGLGIGAAWSVVLTGTAAPFTPGSDQQVALRAEPVSSLGWRILRNTAQQMVVGQTGAGGFALAAPVANGARFTLAVATDAASTAASLNGAPVASNPNGTPPSLPEMLRIGGTNGGTNAWNGRVERIVLFTRRVADAELVAASALAG